MKKESVIAVNLSPIGNDAPFLDANGNPLSGGKLYTYTAGSSTPENTYTTQAGSVANANPVILNSNGYPASGGSVVEIWLTAGVEYKFTLKTSADVTVWERDDISGINDTSVTIDQWVSGPAPTFVSTTSFTLVGDQTTNFHAGRRLKTTNSGGTIYSTITASTFGAVTTVTVANDSGVLDSGLSAVSYGLLASTNPSTSLLTDAYPIVSGSSDKTKKLRIEVDGFTTATTRVLTPPNADLTLPAIAAAGDLVQGSAAGVLTALTLGAAGTRLHSTGSLAEWQGTWFKVGSLTRDMTAASGNVAYTGVGFKPKAIVSTGGTNATENFMMAGFDDGTTRGAVASNPGGAGTCQLNLSGIFIPSAAATSQTAVVASFDSDGFTLTWTKTGSPSAGTATVYFLALR